MTVGARVGDLLRAWESGRGRIGPRRRAAAHAAAVAAWEAAADDTRGRVAAMAAIHAALA